MFNAQLSINWNIKVESQQNNINATLQCVALVLFRGIFVSLDPWLLVCNLFKKSPEFRTKRKTKIRKTKGVVIYFLLRRNLISFVQFGIASQSSVISFPCNWRGYKLD